MDGVLYPNMGKPGGWEVFKIFNYVTNDSDRSILMVLNRAGSYRIRMNLIVSCIELMVMMMMIVYRIDVYRVDDGKLFDE